MSSSFEDKLWKFAETFAKTMNNSAQKKERDLDRRFENGTISDEDYNDSAQKTLAVRENVRGINAPITNNATIIPTGFSSGIVGNSTSLVSK